MTRETKSVAQEKLGALTRSKLALKSLPHDPLRD